jgi:uncharacterized membrane protein
MEKMGVGDFLNFGFENAKKHFARFFGAILLCIVALGILALIGFSISSTIGVLFMIVGSAAAALGFMQNILYLARGESFDFKAFIPQPTMYLNYLIAYVLVSLIVGIGLLLFIIPGLILAVMLNLTLYLVIDKKMGPIEAIKESIARTKGHKGDIFWGLIISNIVGELLSIFVITLFFTIPMLTFVSAYPYLRLTGSLDKPGAKAEQIT